MLRIAIALSCLLLVDCTTERARPAEQSDAPPVQEAGKQPAEMPAKVGGMDEARPTPAPPLTPEEVALIEADPKTLSVEDRRKRAYALRKKIMQNPDSPTARALEDLRKAAEAGTLQLPPGVGSQGPVLHANTGDGKTPTTPMPPAGYRPPAKETERDGSTP